MSLMDQCEAVARRAVSEAGSLVRAAWSQSKQVHYKGPVDIVTETDRQAEALITDHLERAFPDHQIIAEEASVRLGAQRPRSDSPTWYLDPLDGTVNFAHAVPHFSISLGFAFGTEIQLGIVYDPLRDELFIARRGGGATLNGTHIQVSSVAELGVALLATGLPYDRRDRAESYMAFVTDFVREARDVRRFGSAALDLCYVACGRFDGFWEWHLQPWDIAAGSLIVSEAGGRVSRFRGAPLDLFGDETLASNSRVHQAMSTILARRLG